MTDEELLARATEFELIAVDPRDTSIPIPRIRHLSVKRRTYTNDGPAWAIMGDGSCLNHDGEWEWEPQPSSRTEEFFGRCRWADLREAIAFAEDHMTKYPSGYKAYPHGGNPNPRPFNWAEMQAKKRPADYASLSSQDQWEIDKKLGILDWTGQ